MQGVAVAWVAIASPGDLKRERDIIEQSIYDWNQNFTRERGVVFLTLRWERDATPVLGRGDAQEIINQDVIDKSDVLIGVFGNRLGTATSRAISGTVEEIETAQSRGIDPHIFFSSKAIPRDHDPDQFRELSDYRRKLSREGLLAEFSTSADLSRLVHRTLTQEADGSAGVISRMWHGGVGISVRFETLVVADGSLKAIHVFNEGANSISGLTIKSIIAGGECKQRYFLQKANRGRKNTNSTLTAVIIF